MPKLTPHAHLEAKKLRDGDALIRYFEHGIKPGHCFTAILENNLMETFNRADSGTRQELPEIVAWLYNHAPGDSFGSREKVNKFIRDFNITETTTNQYFGII
jgi:hypothetical protein